MSLPWANQPGRHCPELRNCSLERIRLRGMLSVHLRLVVTERWRGEQEEFGLGVVNLDALEEVDHASSICGRVKRRARHVRSRDIISKVAKVVRTKVDDPRHQVSSLPGKCSCYLHHWRHNECRALA